MEDVESGRGMGALTQAHIGLLKFDKKSYKQQMSQKQKKRLQQNINVGVAVVPGTQTIAGLQSSLAFAQNQGISLVDPAYVKSFLTKRAKSEYFGKE